MISKFINTSAVFAPNTYGILYLNSKFNPELADALAQETYSKQMESLATFIYNSILLRLFGIDRDHTRIYELIARYNHTLKADDLGVLEYSERKMKALRFESGPIFELPGKVYEKTIHQYQKRIRKVYFAAGLFEEIRILIKRDSEYREIYFDIDEFEIKLWNATQQKGIGSCVDCGSIKVTHAEQGTRNYFCARCAMRINGC